MDNQESTAGSSQREVRLYLAVFFVLAGAYILSGIVLPAAAERGERIRQALFGFSQMGCLGIPCLLAGLAVPLAVITARSRIDPGLTRRIADSAVRTFNSAWFRVLLSVILVTLFFVLRNRFINYDGRLFAEKFARDISISGAHVTHDEMWELYLHSRFWYFTHAMFGWSVEFSYHVLSSVAGGVFILLLMYYCSVMFPGRPVLAFAICVSGGYMQLFFGDVENYTLTAVLIMAYFLASALFVKGKWRVVTPAVILAGALTFHLLAGFLIPSLLYLFDMAWRRGEKRSVIIAAVSFFVVVALTLLFFHITGLPIRNLWFHSHALGHGGNIRPRLVDPSPGYYFDIFNLAFLLAPVWVFLVPQLVFGRVLLDDTNIHLIIAAAFMGAFFIGWKATLGVYSDWNMFAAAALPFTFLVLRNLLATEWIRRRYWLLYLFAWLFMLHSYSWIISNHFYASQSGM